MEVLQNAEGETHKYKPGGRLDMSHGFLHHIRRNQIARLIFELVALTKPLASVLTLAFL